MATFGPDLDRRIIAVDAFVAGKTPTYKGLERDDIVWLGGRLEIVHHICPICTNWKEETADTCDACAPAVAKLKGAIK